MTKMMIMMMPDWEEILCYRISSNQPGNPNQPAYFILFRLKAKEHFSSELTFTEKKLEIEI